MNWNDYTGAGKVRSILAGALIVVWSGLAVFWTHNIFAGLSAAIVFVGIFQYGYSRGAYPEDHLTASGIRKTMIDRNEVRAIKSKS